MTVGIRELMVVVRPLLAAISTGRCNTLTKIARAGAYAKDFNGSKRFCSGIDNGVIASLEPRRGAGLGWTRV